MAGLESLAGAPGEQRHLLRVLGLAFGVAVGIGSMIGGGILRTPGSVLEQVPYPALALGLWALAGLHALIGANVVAEVMTALPRSGGLFVPARAAFDRPGGLLIGWSDWLTYVAAIAALSLACGEFFILIVPALAGSEALVGAALALMLFLLNWLGVREGSRLQIIGSAAKGLLLIGLALLIFLMPADDAQLEAAPVSLAEPLTLWGIVVAYQLIVGVYSGWPASSYFCEEQIRPEATIPRSLFASVLATAAVYLAVNAALLYALPLAQMQGSALPIATAVAAIFGPLGLKIVAGVGIVIILSCNNANIMVAPRILYGLARDGLFPAVAEKINKGGTPSGGLAITAAVALLLTLTGEFETVFLMMGALGLVPLLVADLAFFKLRRSAPDLHRPYRARFHPWLPGLALALDASVLILFVSADLKSGLSILAAVALCVPIALFMRRTARP